MSKRRDVPGNSMASAVEYERQLIGAAEQLLRFERVADRLFDEGFFLRGCSIKFKGDQRNDYMVVVRAWGAEGAVVSFHNGDTLLECLRGMVARIENGSVKWKEDQYA